MSKGFFLTIGLNAVNKNTYEGWEGILQACENDAKDMATIATNAGLEGVTLLTAQATSSAVLFMIAKAANQLNSGDIFVLTYSGHGGQVGDVTAEDARENDFSVVNGNRVLSAYTLAGVKFWIITEADRSMTMMLLPSEY